MGDEKYHAKLARERRERAINELGNRRHTTVGVLALRAVEEALDACASREKIHFHSHPKTARVKRNKWLNENFPELTKSFETLLEAYEYFRSPRHALGYERAPIYLVWWWRFPTREHSVRATKAVEAMENNLNVLQRKSGIRFK
ncbi:MAG: hypothetical protein AVW06_01405 [Hadesarchaea archaeon DG-33-1]|nr:MAG: hypothetical protein AVW06_01405 [Hadesarchaea archaeon DG-33-1]